MTGTVRPSYPPSLVDWEHFRPLIVRLYIDEKRSLQDVQTLLQAKYDFRASYGNRKLDVPITNEPRIRTFKNKFKQWKVRKNYHENDADSRDAVHSNGLPVPVSRPLVAAHQPAKAHPHLATIEATHTYETGPPRLVLHNESYNVMHSILLSTQAFATSTIHDQAEHVSDAIFRRKRGYLWSSVQHGLTMLECDEIAEGFKSLQDGCNVTGDLLRRPPKYFLLSLFMIMGSSKWTRHQGVRQSLMDFLASISAHVLGGQHPISYVLQHVRDPKEMAMYAESVYKLMLDFHEKSLGSAHEEVLFMKQGLSIELMRQKEYSKGEAIMVEAWNASSLHHGSHSVVTRRCMRRLGNLYYQQDRLEEAEAIFEEIVARGTASPSDLDGCSIITCQNLSMVCAMRDDLIKSEYWADRELEMALQKWGSEDKYYIGCCQRRDARKQGAPNPQWFSWLEIT